MVYANEYRRQDPLGAGGARNRQPAGPLSFVAPEPMSRVFVTIVSPAENFGPHWDALIPRARVNVFLSPAALNAVHAMDFAKVHVLLAWERHAQPERLVGVWALWERKILNNGPAYLSTPAYDYSFLSNPVIDPEFMDETMAAFLDAVERHPSLPNSLRLFYLDGECASYRALERALTVRRSPMHLVSERLRPAVSRSFGQKRQSSTTIKKLRQQYNRLSKIGPIEIVNAREHDAAMAAFDDFVALEAASWKGERGTALANRKKDLAFTRALLSNLAKAGNASVALMKVGDRSVASQVMLYCENIAYTWKVAFDAEFSSYSPGVQLMHRLTEQLLSTTEIDEIESCAHEGSFLSKLWDGERRSVNLLVRVGKKRSLTFAVLVAMTRVRAKLKEWRNTLQEGRRSVRPLKPRATA